MSRLYSTTSAHPHWEHTDAVQQLDLLTTKYGPPSHFSPAKGGMAVWDQDKLEATCFARIEVMDESVPHCAPAPHRDFLYTHVNYEVPDDKVLDVVSLSGSVAYDPLKKMLRARCGSEEANIATLYLATKIASGATTLAEVQAGQLYTQAILSTPSPQSVQYYLDELCSALQNQPGDPRWSGVFRRAFPDGCCANYNPELNTCGSSLAQSTYNSPGMGPAKLLHVYAPGQPTPKGTLASRTRTW